MCLQGVSGAAEKEQEDHIAGHIPGSARGQGSRLAVGRSGRWKWQERKSHGNSGISNLNSPGPFPVSVPVGLFPHVSASELDSMCSVSSQQSKRKMQMQTRNPKDLIIIFSATIICCGLWLSICHCGFGLFPFQFSREMVYTHTHTPSHLLPPKT